MRVNKNFLIVFTAIVSTALLGLCGSVMGAPEKAKAAPDRKPPKAAKAETPSAPGKAVLDPDKTYRQAANAFQNKEYQKAHKLYSQLVDGKGLSWLQRRTVARRLAQINDILRVEKRRKKTAEKVLARIAASCKDKEFEDSRVDVLHMKHLRRYLTDKQKEQLAAYQKQIDKALGVKPEPPIEQQRKLACDLFNKGIALYEKKHFAEAGTTLRKAAALDVGLGDDERALSRALKDIDTTLRTMQGSYTKGKILFKLGQYEQAHTLFLQLKNTGVKAGKQFDEGVASHLEKSVKRIAERKKAAQEALLKVVQLCKDKKYTEAEQALKAVEKLKKGLTPQQLRELDNYRVQVAEALGKKAPPAGKELRELASGCLRAGLAAYKAKDYVTAQEHLKKAEALKDGLTGRDARKLSSTLNRIASAVKGLRERFSEGERLFKSKQYEPARTVLSGIRDEGVAFDPKVSQNIDTYLAEIDKKLAEREAEAKKAFATVERLIGEKKLKEAETALASVRKAHAKDPAVLEHAEQYSLRIEEAARQEAERLGQQKRNAALKSFEAGMAAYENRNYVAAKSHLDKVTAAKADLGWWKNRRLRKTLKVVNSTLQNLQETYERAEALFRAEKYESAKMDFSEILESGIECDPNIIQGAKEYLTQIAQKAPKKVAVAPPAKLPPKKVKAPPEPAKPKLPPEKVKAPPEPAKPKLPPKKVKAPPEPAKPKLPPKKVKARPEPAEQPRAVALKHFQDGIECFKGKDYIGAKTHLDMVMAMKVDLGWRKMRKIRKALEDIDSTLRQLRSKYQRGVTLFRIGKYEDAEKAFRQVRDKGISCGPDIAEGVEEYLAQIAQKAPKKVAVAPEKPPKMPPPLKLPPKKVKAPPEPAKPKLPPKKVKAPPEPAVRQAALESFRVGMAAYTSKNYVTARAHLLKAVAIRKVLGRTTEKKARKALDDISATLKELQSTYKRGEESFRSQDYEAARKAFEKVRDSGVNCGPEISSGIEKYLPEIEKKIALQKAEREKAFAAIDELINQKKLKEAEAALAKVRQAFAEDPAALKVARDYSQKIAAAAEQQAQRLAQQKRSAALKSFEAGMAAYENKDYVAAKSHLDEAAAAKLDLGRRRNRRLRKCLKVVNSTLRNLQDTYERAEALFRAEKYESAKMDFSEILESGIECDPNIIQGAKEYLTQIAQKAPKKVAVAPGKPPKMPPPLKLPPKKVKAPPEPAKPKLPPKKVKAPPEPAKPKLPPKKVKKAPEAAVRQAALESFRAGMAAYTSKNYVTARAHLLKAVAIRKVLGRTAEKKARKALDDINATLKELQNTYKQGEGSFRTQKYEAARKAFEKVRDSGINCGPEISSGIEKYLPEIEKKIASQKAEREKAFATIDELINQKKLKEAEAALAKVRQAFAEDPAARRLAIEYTKKIAAAAEQQAQRLAQQKRSAALKSFEAGMAAYENRNYVAAKSHLDKVTAAKADLGWWKNRRLRKTLKVVNSTLQNLQETYERGEGAFRTQKYEAARKAFQKVRDSGVNCGPEISSGIEKYLPEIERKIASQKAKREKAFAAIDELINQNKFKEAETALAKVRQGFAKDPAARRLAIEYTEKIAAAAEQQAQRLAAEKRPVALAHLNKGLQAYREKDYPTAKRELEQAVALKVDLGAVNNRTMQHTLRDVGQTLGKLHILFKQGEDSFTKNKFEEARDTLLEIKRGGIRLGLDMDEKLESYLSQAQRAIRDRKLAVAKKTLKEVTRLTNARTGLLRSVQAKQEMTRKAQLALAGARNLSKERDYAQARKLLLDAQNLLKDAEIEEGSVLAGLKSKIGEQLENLNEKIARKAKEEEQRRAAAAKITSLMAEARDLFSKDALAAERKVVGLRSVARQAGIRLTDQQQEFCNEVLDAVDAQYGKIRAKYRTRYGALMDEISSYQTSREYRKARDVLKLLEKSEHLALAGLEEADIKGRLALVGKELEDQQGALTKARALAQDAEKARVDNPRQAAEKYKTAVRLAMGKNVPAEEMIALLEGWRETASEVSQAELATRDDTLKKAAAKELKELCANKTAIFARHFMTEGSADLAKPYLESIVKDTAGFESPDVDWAKNQLENIDEKIATLKEAELLTTEPELNALYRLEKQFSNLMQKGDSKAAQKLGGPILNAQATLHLARAKVALQRGAPSAAAEALETAAAGGIARELTKQYTELLEKLEPWVETKNIFAEAEGAIADSRLEEASNKLSAARGHGLPGPYAKLHTALSGVLGRLKMAQTERERATQELAHAAEVAAEHLRRGKCRKVAYEPYQQARALYLAEDWKAALESTNRAQVAREGLHKLERKNLHRMIAECRHALGKEAVPEPVEPPAKPPVVAPKEPVELDKLSAVAEARRTFQKAQEQVKAGNIKQAKRLLKKLTKMKGFSLDPKLADEVRKLQGAMALPQAVADARRVLSLARKAFEGKDYIRASAQLDALRKLAAYSRDESIATEAKVLEEAILEKETAAEKLYRKAVAAHEAGNAGSVRRILERLKRDYERTKTYRDNL